MTTEQPTQGKPTRLLDIAIKRVTSQTSESKRSDLLTLLIIELTDEVDNLLTIRCLKGICNFIKNYE
jgi:hypothetical protein